MDTFWARRLRFCDCVLGTTFGGSEDRMDFGLWAMLTHLGSVSHLRLYDCQGCFFMAQTLPTPLSTTQVTALPTHATGTHCSMAPAGPYSPHDSPHNRRSCQFWPHIRPPHPGARPNFPQSRTPWRVSALQFPCWTHPRQLTPISVTSPSALGAPGSSRCPYAGTE